MIGKRGRRFTAKRPMIRTCRGRRLLVRCGRGPGCDRLLPTLYQARQGREGPPRHNEPVVSENPARSPTAPEPHLGGGPCRGAGTLCLQRPSHLRDRSRGIHWYHVRQAGVRPVVHPVPGVVGLQRLLVSVRGPTEAVAAAKGGAHIANVEYPASALGTPYPLNIKTVCELLDAEGFSELPIFTNIREEPRLRSSAGQAALGVVTLQNSPSAGLPMRLSGREP